MDDLQRQVQQNAEDIREIKTSILTIQNNHLHHIEKDMDGVKRDTEHLKEKIGDVDKKVDRMDTRLFWILGLLVVGIVVPAFIKGLMGG